MPNKAEERVLSVLSKHDKLSSIELMRKSGLGLIRYAQAMAALIRQGAVQRPLIQEKPKDEWQLINKSTPNMELLTDYIKRNYTGKEAADFISLYTNLEQVAEEYKRGPSAANLARLSTLYNAAFYEQGNRLSAKYLPKLEMLQPSGRCGSCSARALNNIAHYRYKR